MGFAIGRARGRARWLGLFTVLLLISSAVPVLAESTPPGQPEEAPVLSEAEAGEHPTAADVANGIDEAESVEGEEEELRETPQAEREREESKLAYSDVSPAEAAELLREEFSEQLALIDQDPARALTDAEVERALGPTGALVELEGDRVLVDGTMPVRTPDEEGDLRKVSLDLEPAADGSFVSDNALVDLELPREASEPMQIGKRGLAISPVLPEGESLARPFGEKDLLYTDALEATDLLLTPISSGLELSALLRSVESPEELRFELTLPPGAELRSDGEGGAQVVRDAEPIASVRPPTAVDAQGAEVPVSMQVQGAELVLSIEHRNMDLAYPALVDPIVDEWYGSLSWYAGYNLQGLSDGSWGTTSNDYGRFKFETQPWYSSSFEGSNKGLFISYQGGTETQWAYRHGAWVYTVPGGTTHILAAGASPFWRHNNNCSVSQYPKPHDYIGLWSNDWNQWVYSQIDAAQVHKHAFAEPPGDWRKIIAEQLHIGLAVGIYNTAPLPCNRDLYVGGVYIWMDDLEDPTLSSVGNPTTEWVSDDKPFTMTASASDAGLGVKSFNVWPQGELPFDQQPAQNQCTGLRASPCPASRTNTLIYLDADRFREGQRTATISAKDPLGKVSASHQFETKVDRTPPEITLSGQLAVATKEENGDLQDPGKWEDLSLPVYNLEIEATDVGTESDANARKRSGVKDIEIYLDEVEQEVPWSPQSPTQDSLPMTKTYELKLSTLTSAGKHKLKVVAVDQVGKKLAREIEFEYFPATGMKDEYVMHYFPLPDGTGSEAEEEHPDRPELAVNVMNGNLVYRERDVEVDGTASVDLKVERYYNSMLPDSENGEWGDGWTLAETPDLKLLDTGGSSAPDEANLLGSGGLLTGGLVLPTEAGTQKFDPVLQATLLKQPSGGYKLTDETGESATSVVFDETGQTEALVTEGHAKVDYSYEGGELAEIEVIDPSTFAADPEELEIPAPELVTAPTYASSFGTNGSGDGQLKSPGDVALDPAGNIWVADRVNHRIQKFDSNGKFLFKFGTLGFAFGALYQPAALALDPAGNVWVADKGNHKIKKFNSKGEFLASYGSQGTGNGQFASGGPEGIAVDSKGNVWVSDTYGGRLQKFNSAGEFVKAIGTKGSGLGQLGEPTGLDVAPDGKVWVADWQNNRIAVFNEAGEFVFHFGVQGTGNGAFDRPGEIEIDAHGNVWVGDHNNHRVQQFNQGAEYVAQFGSYGAGDGKFSFARSIGIAADSKGHLWVADRGNNRIQRWLVPIPNPTYAYSFGANGSGDGQLNSPADVAIDFHGNLWVADKSNHRIQKFDPNGNFLAKYGSLGSGEGQFDRPSSVAVDRDGHILVADSNNHRIQKLNTAGEFLSKFGSLGTGNGQLNRPEEVLADAKGNIWVADAWNGRAQRFDEEGNFLEVVDSGQLSEPTGIDVDGAGNVWIADGIKNRLSIFDSEGEFKSNIGSAGSGNGQFNRPDAIEIDNKGNVWVGDQGNHRVQRFDLAGQYVGQFGSYGADPGQFNLAYPMGLAADREGHLWATDPYNHRVQQWRTANYAPAQPTQLDLSDGDAKVEVETSSDLVTGVSGVAAGEHSYEHEGNFLVSHDGPEGETSYEKDASGRLSKIMLPNGTSATIEYEAALGRVKKVAVSIEGGPAKTTEFDYKDGPRRTTVIPPDAPHVTYDIGDDGSVFKWWHVAKPPEFLDISGSLWSGRGTEVSTGDHTLKVVADSPHGIASIRFIANGNQLVDEKTCAQDPEKEGIECVSETNEWVTHALDHAPGILNLEAVVTNRLGESESERFWVNIPYTSPPTPGVPVPPRFKDILKFREGYGLEVVFPVANETELNERIFDLIGAWHNPHTPIGEVARASWERWGVPLRPADIAELEYRERYIAYNGPLIGQWGEVNHPTTYAGYFVDHRAGGIMRIGFATAQQSSLVEQIKKSSGLIETDRIAPFLATPTHPLSSLESLQFGVSGYRASHPNVLTKITRNGIDIPSNRVSVGATDVPTVSSALYGAFGQQAPLTVYYNSNRFVERSGRYRISDQVRAGDAVQSTYTHECEDGSQECSNTCTAAFGAQDEVSPKPNGELINAYFILTAGHCFEPSEAVFRAPNANPLPSELVKIGSVRRAALLYRASGFESDAEAIKVDNPNLVSRWIHLGNGAMKFGPAKFPEEGQTVCLSGKESNRVSCGPVIGPPEETYYEDLERGKTGILWLVPAEVWSIPGDSGSPLWGAYTGDAMGILSGGPEDNPNITLIQPLMPWVEHESEAPGALNAPEMLPLRVLCWNGPPC